MSSLFFAALLDPTKISGPPQPPQFDITAVAAVPGQRASSPLRKHKRKAVPHRSALDTGTGEETTAQSEVESRPKERRGSASPPAVEYQARAARPQRAAAAHHLLHPPTLPDMAAPAPDQLAAVFGDNAPPPFLVDVPTVGAQKFCVQCGTTVTPMWRSVNGLTYCNADGLRLKRRLGLL